MPVFFFLFILLYCGLMPLLFGVRNVLVLPVDSAEIALPVRLLSKQFYDIAFTPDYFL